MSWQFKLYGEDGIFYNTEKPEMGDLYYVKRVIVGGSSESDSESDSNSDSNSDSDSDSDNEIPRVEEIEGCDTGSDSESSNDSDSFGDNFDDYDLPIY